VQKLDTAAASLGLSAEQLQAFTCFKNMLALEAGPARSGRVGQQQLRYPAAVKVMVKKLFAGLGR
jgi:hypothetical protein